LACLHLREWGSGDRHAVLIHGLSGYSATWTWVAPELAERGYHVLAPDLRGHGLSPRGTYSTEEWAADLVENLPAEPELAVGHSMGGALLLAASSRLKPAYAVYEDPAWGLAVDPEKTIVEFEARKLLTIEDIARANPRWPADVVRSRRDGLAIWDESTARGFIGRDRDLVPTGPPVGPSLVVLAEGSPYVPAAAADRLRSMGWVVRRIPGTGHHLHIDDRPAFLSNVLDWVTEQSHPSPQVGG
jgi:pimeloyl-ACP methyl ester carboxylesterase